MLPQQHTVPPQLRVILPQLHNVLLQLHVVLPQHHVLPQLQRVLVSYWFSPSQLLCSTAVALSSGIHCLPKTNVDKKKHDKPSANDMSVAAHGRACGVYMGGSVLLATDVNRHVPMYVLMQCIALTVTMTWK